MLDAVGIGEEGLSDTSRRERATVRPQRGREHTQVEKSKKVSSKEVKRGGTLVPAAQKLRS